MTEATLELDQYLCFAIHSAAQAVGRANKKLLDKLGLTYPQFLVMLVLWTEDGLTVGQIGDRLFLESNTLTPLLKRLQAAGLITRSRCLEDERQVRVRLTEQGHALREVAKSVKPEWIERAFGGDLDEVAALRRKITLLRDKLLAAEDA
ncbi:MarR family transcriptional regulator [Siccirubricoccus sp. KC 17139]|uniref:MarR family transcriptional regulator n=1 Tax=Siccirubricoccus soli TaxID=2899147 RepID=A0ABT1D062_9PROT|nr:MarR family transcriptional regulator [Siccirubricoccus soli]MCO6415279.1 MarR family transcriptional regulator [Siccirubricoccus soli]MCP2681410.1 MarR family transcriptional regulator [Siccirubricoccus soli]